MTLLKRVVFVASWLTILPASAYAQATLAGVVKDALAPCSRRDGRGVEPGADRKNTHGASPTAPGNIRSSICGPAPTRSRSRCRDSRRVEARRRRNLRRRRDHDQRAT